MHIPLSSASLRESISSAKPDTLYNPSASKPLLSISVIHLSTTNGRAVRQAFTNVVRSIPNTPLNCFRSGQQSEGTFSEHLLCAQKPQSETQ